jgi:hypothetical protein
VVSVGLKNSPRIRFTPEKSPIKKKRDIKQGDSRCKMARAGFHSLAKLLAQMCTADRGNPNKIIMLRNARDITDVKI